MNDSFVTKGSVFDNMPLSPANKGSLENSYINQSKNGKKENLNNSK
jgi:hypothetical protein